jgi:hypothetical protein
MKPPKLAQSVNDVDDDDENLHSCCHTQEGIGHVLQAGEQATRSFILMFRKKDGSRKML